MSYNIHPIIVHFPIALLFIYSIIKILPFEKYFQNISWKQVEIFLLTIGTLGAFVASTTGEIAEELISTNRQLVESHSFFADISTFLFGALLLGELLLILINSKYFTKIDLPKTKDLLIFIQKILTNKIFSKIIAFLGLIAISITGMLGGVIVYGTSADPLAVPLLNLLNITL